MGVTASGVDAAPVFVNQESNDMHFVQVVYSKSNSYDLKVKR